MPESGFEKTEAPTQRRLDEARRDGNLARSQDLTAAFIVVASMLALYFLGVNLLNHLRMMSVSVFGGEHASNLARPDDVAALAAVTGRHIVYGLGPVLVVIALVALIASFGQVGFLLTFKPLEPRLNKISPLQGIKRMFDARAGIRLVMSLLKVILIGGVSYLLIADDLEKVVKLMELGVNVGLGAAAELAFWLGIKLAAILLVLAILDYAFQKWKHMQDMKMTKQELKEEMKRMDGDPHIKQRRARVARQLALQRVAAAVPQADVIVTNPTHFAIALKYNPDKMSAPKVVAKGADYLALRIRQIAMSHGVPLVERKALARALYRDVEVGQEVPPDYYNAVAEILAYVYRISGRRSA